MITWSYNAAVQGTGSTNARPMLYQIVTALSLPWHPSCRSHWMDSETWFDNIDILL